MSDAAMLLIDYILAKISRGPRPYATLRVWNAALAHTAPDTGALVTDRATVRCFDRRVERWQFAIAFGPLGARHRAETIQPGRRSSGQGR